MLGPYPDRDGTDCRSGVVFDAGSRGFDLQ